METLIDEGVKNRGKKVVVEPITEQEIFEELKSVQKPIKLKVPILEIKKPIPSEDSNLYKPLDNLLLRQQSQVSAESAILKTELIEMRNSPLNSPLFKVQTKSVRIRNALQHKIHNTLKAEITQEQLIRLKDEIENKYFLQLTEDKIDKERQRIHNLNMRRVKRQFANLENQNS